MSEILEDIYNLTLKLLLPLTVEDTYAIIVEEARKLMDAECGSLFLAQPDGMLKRVFSTVPLERQIELRKGDFKYKSFHERKAFIISGTRMKKVHPEFAGTKEERTFFIPLYYNNQSTGVLSLISKKKIPITAQKLHIIEVLGTVASLKIRNLDLYTEIKRILESRDQFISLASHELKTPITTISGYLQLIDKKIRDGDQECVKPEWITEMQGEITRLSRLIDKLLNVQQIHAGKVAYHWSHYSLFSLLNVAISQTKIMYPHQQIAFIETPDQKVANVLCDKEKLLQVFVNILSNASKFSPDHLPIEVSLREKSHMYVISIKDKGAGIAKEDLPEVFSEFHKGATDHNRRGLGLGLYISKQIVQQHGGEIEIHSAVKKGTEVLISLPRV